MSLASSQFLREVFDELEKQDGLEKVRQNDDCRRSVTQFTLT